MTSWDDEDFEPAINSLQITTATANKWEGEDEEDDVKDNWEDEDDSTNSTQKDVDNVEEKPQKKKTLAEKIAERERKKLEEKRLKEQEEIEISNEERIRMEKESDLKLALETTFGDAMPSSFDIKVPTSKEEFSEFSNTLTNKLLLLSKHSEYFTFVENLVRNLCATMSPNDIKKIKANLDNLFIEKQKLEKDKSKKGRTKNKARLNVDSDPLSAYVDIDYNEFDDFM